jgi:hypothetical protein
MIQIKTENLGNFIRLLKLQFQKCNRSICCFSNCFRFFCRKRSTTFTINKLVNINFHGCQGIFQIYLASINFKISQLQLKCQ